MRRFIPHGLQFRTKFRRSKCVRAICFSQVNGRIPLPTLVLKLQPDTYPVPFNPNHDFFFLNSFLRDDSVVFFPWMEGHVRSSFSSPPECPCSVYIFVQCMQYCMHTSSNVFLSQFPAFKNACLLPTERSIEPHE